MSQEKVVLNMNHGELHGCMRAPVGQDEQKKKRAIFLSILFLEFAKIYEKLGVTLIERGESFYQDLMGAVVEDLEKRGDFC